MRPSPRDLAVSDIVMPGLNGRQLAAELQHRRPGLRVLLVSGHPGDAVFQGGTVDADVELLPKPFTTAALLARVRALLDAG